MRGVLVMTAIGVALIVVALAQSPAVALSILQLCLISALMSLGLNIQWGYAGLFSAGVMGSAALGGLAAVLVSSEPVAEAWRAGGTGLLAAALSLFATIAAVMFARRRLSRHRNLASVAICVIGFLAIRAFFDPATRAIEAVDPAQAGFLGGLGLPIVLSWPVGGLFAAAAAYLIGKTALGLRSDYFAIATLGISEVVLAILKNEDWLARGVKNVSGLDRPVPYELELKETEWLRALVEWRGPIDPAQLDRALGEAASIVVDMAWAGLFAIVLVVALVLAERALNSPWGRMMRAIRDDEDAAAALGKDVEARRLQAFVLGSAVIGIAGAMLVTLDGQFTPGSYTPLRFTFLIWVMVIVGGSGNNWGAIAGGFLIWFVWIEAEPAGAWAMAQITALLAEDSAVRAHLIEAAPHARLLVMGLTLIIALRFAPKGLIPERSPR